MPVLRKDGDAYLVYERKEQDGLVAISKEDQKLIKKFWKQYKGKQQIPADEVPGFPFVMEPAQESLRIDFEQPMRFVIRDLIKFD